MKKFRLFILTFLLILITVFSSLLIDKQGVTADGADPAAPAVPAGETAVQQCQTFNIVATGEKVDDSKYYYEDNYNHTGLTANATQDYEGKYGSKARNLGYAVYKATCTDDAYNSSIGEVKTYTAYCIDAGISGPDTGGTNSYVLEEQLDLNAADSWGKASRGLLYIYKQGGYDIVQQSMAMRLIMTKWGVTVPNSKYKEPFIETYKAIDNGTWNRTTWDTLGKNEDGQLKTSAFYPKTYVADNQDYKIERANNFAVAVSALYSGAKSQEDASLADVTEVKLEIGEVTLNNPTFNADGTFTSEARVLISGLDSITGTGSYVHFKDLTCGSGVTCSTSISTSDNLVGLSADGKTYEMVINVSGTASSLTSNSFKISLSFDYYTSSDSNNVLLVVDAAPSVEYQRFVLFDEDATGQILKKDGEDVSMCEKLASDPVLSSSTEWTNYYNTYCNPTCFSSPNLVPSDRNFDPNLFKTMCCDSIDSFAGDTDYDAARALCVDTDYCVTYSLPAHCDLEATNDKGWVLTSMYEGIPAGEDKVDYKNCVLSTISDAEGRKDAADNPLRIVKNNYCEVSCFESWDFKLPNKNFAEVNGTAIKAGMYFALAAELKGQRTCVSSFEIDYSQFEEDVDTANKQAVEEFNGYLREDAKLEASKDDSKIDVVTQTIDIKESREKKVATIANTVTDPDTGATTTTYSCPSYADRSSGSGASLECFEYYYVSVGTVECVDYYDLKWAASQQGYNKDDSDYKTESSSYDNSDVTSALDASYHTEPAKIERDIAYSDPSPSAIGDKTDPHTCTKVVPGFSASADITNSERNQFEIAKNSYYSNYEDLVADIEGYIDNIQLCSNWTDEVNESFYDPKITFEYDEEHYMTMIGSDNEFVTSKSNSEMVVDDETEVIYCDKSSENPSDPTVYECPSSGTSLPYSHIRNDSFYYISCDKATKKCYKNPSVSGAGVSVDDIPVNLSVKEVVTLHGLYKPKPTFYTTHPDGTIEMTDQDNNSLIDIGGGYQGHVLPISINTGAGYYKYKLTLSNIGKFNGVNNSSVDSNTEKGRLIGHSDGIYNKALSKLEYEFLCTYEVKEDPCICCGSEGITERIEIDTSGNILWDEVNKEFVVDPNNDPVSTSGRLNFTYRPISINEIGNDLSWTVGTNWGTTKGLATLAEINDPVSGKEHIYENPEYSFLVTPEGIAQLQQIGVSDEGEDLSCTTQQVPVIEGGTEEGVVCLSDLITGIYNGTDYDGISVDGIMPLVNRPGFTYRRDTMVIVDINDVISDIDDSILAKKTVVYASAWK